jgi:hypothetical protein
MSHRCPAPSSLFFSFYFKFHMSLINVLKAHISSWAWWGTLVIPSTQMATAGGSWVSGQPRQRYWETLSQKQN